MDNKTSNNKPLEIPTPEANPEFYALITNPIYANINVLMIINELRKYEPEVLNDAQCRTQLAKLKAFQTMIDFPYSVINKEEDDGVTDELRD